MPLCRETRRDFHGVVSCVVAFRGQRLTVEVAADAWPSRAAAARSYLQDRDGYKSATRRPHDSQVVLCTKRAPSVVYSIQEVGRLDHILYVRLNNYASAQYQPPIIRQDSR